MNGHGSDHTTVTRMAALTDRDEIRGVMERLADGFYDRSIDIDGLSRKIAAYGVFLTAYAGDSLAGFAGYYANDMQTRTGYLTTIVVAQEHRREGVGSALLRDCMRDCRERGMETFKLEVRRDNEKAIRLYRQMGFFLDSPASDISDYYIRRLDTP